MLWARSDGFRGIRKLTFQTQNTYSTAIAIGEKAAFLIAQDLDIHGFF